MTDSARINALLRQAETACAERGERFTPLRRRVLELVAEAGEPVKAYDLLENMKVGPGAAKPPTVYRALDFLMRAGLIHRVEALKAFIACDHAHEEGGELELYICESCGHVDEADRPAIDPGAPDGFSVQHSVVEHYGVCGECVNDA